MQHRHNSRRALKRPHSTADGNIDKRDPHCDCSGAAGSLSLHPGKQQPRKTRRCGLSDAQGELLRGPADAPDLVGERAAAEDDDRPSAAERLLHMLVPVAALGEGIGGLLLTDPLRAHTLMTLQRQMARVGARGERAFRWSSPRNTE